MSKFKYSFEIQLDYSYVNETSYSRKIIYKYDESAWTMNGIKIKLKNEFRLEIDNVIGENQEEAFEYAYGIIEKVCRVLTLILQIGNYDSGGYCPNINYYPYKLKMNYKEELKSSKNFINNSVVSLDDDFRLQDGINAICKEQELDISIFESLYYLVNKSDDLNIGEVICRAARTQDIQSRFFQLFTIIEKIETKYRNDEDICRPLLNEQQVEYFEQNIGIENLSNSLNAKEYEMLRSRILQIVKSATLKGRPEKLTEIIRRKFKISKIKKGCIEFEIDSKKMKSFIDVRNRLFHGDDKDSEGNQELILITNELQELCLQLLRNEGANCEEYDRNW